jgi:hypothetical protein
MRSFNGGDDGLVHGRVRRHSQASVEHGDGFLGAGAVYAEKHRHLRRKGLPGVDDPFCHDIGARKSAAEIDHQAFHVWIVEHQLEGGFGLGVCLTADFQKIRRLAAMVGDDIHGGHGEAGAIGEHADCAVQGNVTQAEIAATLFQCGQPFCRSQPLQLRLPLNTRIVQHELAIQRDQSSIGEHRQGIDFQQLGVVLTVAGIQLDQELGHRVLHFAQIQSREHPGGGVDIESGSNIHRGFANGARVRLRDLLDVHATGSGEHHQRTLARGAVEDGGIKLTSDARLLLDQQSLDPVSADIHAEDAAGRLPCPGLVLRRQNTAGLTAFSGGHLSLDNHRRKLPGCSSGFVYGHGQTTPRYVNTGGGE